MWTRLRSLLISLVFAWRHRDEGPLWDWTVGDKASNAASVPNVAWQTDMCLCMACILRMTTVCLCYSSMICLKRGYRKATDLFLWTVSAVHVWMLWSFCVSLILRKTVSILCCATIYLWCLCEFWDVQFEFVLQLFLNVLIDYCEVYMSLCVYVCVYRCEHLYVFFKCFVASTYIYVPVYWAKIVSFIYIYVYIYIYVSVHTSVRHIFHISHFLLFQIFSPDLFLFSLFTNLLPQSESDDKLS